MNPNAVDQHKRKEEKNKMAETEDDIEKLDTDIKSIAMGRTRKRTKRRWSYKPEEQ